MTCRNGPSARTGRGAVTGSGQRLGHVAAAPAAPARLRPGRVRTTESSTRRTTSRSWSRNRSAIAPSRATASRFPRQIGSSLALPEVMTRAVVGRVAEQLDVQRRGGEHHAEVAEARRHAVGHRGRLARRGARTHGRLRRGEQRLVLRVQPHQLPRRLEVADHHRERLRGAALALPQPRHAASSSARHASWNPPSPFTATISPRSQRLPRRLDRRGSLTLDP